MDLFQISTKYMYSLDYGLDPSTFLPLISNICCHYQPNFIFSCVLSTEPSFQQIFFKFTPNIHRTKIETLIQFYVSLITFVATGGPTFLCASDWTELSTYFLHISLDQVLD